MSRAVRGMLKSILVQYGYKVLEGIDGKHGLKIFYQHRDEIDLVLLDLSLPAMSGQEVLTELRVRSPEVRVIICTGYAASRPDFAGASEVVQKPFKVKKLVQIMRQVLDT